ncbi:ribbon-helix-helix protein, CopG family [Thermodesulfobacteriota bacterium]
MSKIMIGIKVTPELKKLLEEEAAKEHRSLANFIKHALLIFLEEHKKIDFKEE